MELTSAAPTAAAAKKRSWVREKKLDPLEIEGGIWMIELPPRHRTAAG
jgi:hypothetical protein